LNIKLLCFPRCVSS